MVFSVWTFEIKIFTFIVPVYVYTGHVYVLRVDAVASDGISTDVLVTVYISASFWFLIIIT